VTDELELSLLERLCATPGVSGREEAVRALVREELAPLVDEVSTDAIGNLIAVRRGDGTRPRILLAAHMDEVGFLVRHVEDDGFLRIHPVGGIFPKYELAQRVRVHTADGPLGGVIAEPTDLQMANEESKVPKLEECFVDVGSPLDEIHAKVRPGDPVTVDRALERFGDHVVSKALDDRIGLFIIIETLRRLPRGAAEVTVVGSVQEEIGLRGVSVAAHRIEKDVAVAVDTTMARDLPTVPPGKVVTRLGAGVSLKVMDRGQITSAPLLRFTQRLAGERGIATQLEVGLPGGTDADAIEISGDGAPSIALSIPTRYPHTASETVHVADIGATMALLAAFLETVTVADLAHD
jgi:endoglucanase